MTNETKIKKAAENYDKLVDLVDVNTDWVEIQWDEYNTDLKNAFIAGAQFVLDHAKIKIAGIEMHTAKLILKL